MMHFSQFYLQESVYYCNSFVIPTPCFALGLFSAELKKNKADGVEDKERYRSSQVDKTLKWVMGTKH